MRKLVRSALTLALVLAMSGCQQEPAEVSFTGEIKPILDSKCLACHSGQGEGSEASGFSVLTYEDIMRGTQFGPVIEPGDRVSSTFYRLVAHLTDPKIHMPPSTDESLAEGRVDPLTAEQIELIGAWIDQGAKNN